MSLWEFTACVDGFMEAHGAKPEPDPPSFDEHLEMAKRFAAMTGGA